MTAKAFRYDEISYWSEVKLDIIKKYAAAYSTVMARQAAIQRYAYIDAFAGAGKHISRKTGEFIPGSPLNALAVEPPFGEFHLIDLHGGKAEYLRNVIGERSDVFVYEADANQVLIEKVFPRCRYQDFHRGLCLLDPYKLAVDWKVIETAGNMKSIEIFYNFMIMDANMNVLWRRSPSKVDSKQLERMDKVWGDRSWYDAAYQKQHGLFGDIEVKRDNDAIVAAFRARLETVAGFKYVPEPIPMRNDRGAVVYYLFFASSNKTGAHIVENIFTRYKDRGVS
jgi:three-Cys-motif partner protein